MKLLNGDALEEMKQLEVGSAEAVLTDPPYCSSAKISSAGTKRYGWFSGDNIGVTGFFGLMRGLGVQCTRVLKEGGSLLCFCDWRSLPIVCAAIESAGLAWGNIIVWAKPSPALGNGFRSQHELCLHFNKGKPKYYSRRQGNVILCKRPLPQTRLHQTEKPVELLKPLLRVVAKEGDTVVDPFMGSGSTGETCKELGMDFIGIERDPQIFEVARNRLKKAA